MEKKKATKSDKVYVFRVSLDLDTPIMEFGKINQRIRKSKRAPWREIAVLGNHSLYDFAKVISESFGFILDHCFGFYSNFGEKTKYDSKEIYELFNDLEGVEHTLGAKGVEKVKIARVFREKGKKMLFYFDYGDSWGFPLVLKEIDNPELRKFYPVLLDSQGENPEQYPPIEE